MKSVGTAVVIAGGLASATFGVLLVAQAAGLLHDPAATAVANAAELSRATAVQSIVLVESRRYSELERCFTQLAASGGVIRSAGFRDAQGMLQAASPSHSRRWAEAARLPQGDLRSVSLPITAGGKPAGALELLVSVAPSSSWLTPGKTIICIVAACMLLFLVLIKRVLRYLDPSAVISDRVRTMLNTLSEGVLVVDQQGNIVMSNDAFSAISGKPAQELQGESIDHLQWRFASTAPWRQAIDDHASVRCECIRIGEQALRSLMVSCSPIRGADASVRGVLVTVNDITAIEQKNIELQIANEQIERQNRELQTLATTDPLTGCMNRRAFFNTAETRWKQAERYGQRLACIMLDIDHFKKINDGHGHAAGDKVLTEVGALLRQHLRDGDLLCRYGGEEFCAFLTNATVEDAAQAAERFRAAIEQAHCGGLDVTISLGVAQTDPTTCSVAGMLEHADTALYASKHNGRNQVTRWDQLPPADPNRAAA